jgi:hypothetical protein
MMVNHTLDDVSLEDPPLEEVISQAFAQSADAVELLLNGHSPPSLANVPPGYHG